MALFDKLKTGEEYLPSFKQSHIYLKLLEELDLVQQQAEEDAISIGSLECADDETLKIKENNTSDGYPPTKNLKLGGVDNFLTIESSDKSLKHVRSLSDVTDFSRSKYDIIETNRDVNVCKPVQNNGCAAEKNEEKEKDQKTGDFTLKVDIIQTGVINEKGKAFGVYALHVSKQYATGYIEEWHIYRRYSDFYDLHNKIKDRFPDLSKLTFPGKKTFHNTDRAVLERRMRMLGSYMHTLCKDSIINTHGGLKALLMTFLEQGEYDRANSGGPISHTIDTLVNPLKSGMKTIKNMPEQIINTVDEVVEGLNKVFHSKQGPKSLEASKLGASIDPESDDNIPLRIMLLLMDEVFDLKCKNQWLRRRIVTLLRQIVRTMFGDIVNRRILDYVSFITSPKNVAHYLHIFKQSFWPNGVKAEKKPERCIGKTF
ncbi:PX domain [Popillia japonica]|uniref:PX domain n=1 Tax=Popillia japonica TaxID=7064 RepID=A0AAW1I740_POPJA